MQTGTICVLGNHEFPYQSAQIVFEVGRKPHQKKKQKQHNQQLNDVSWIKKKKIQAVRMVKRRGEEHSADQPYITLPHSSTSVHHHAKTGRLSIINSNFLYQASSKQAN